MEYCLIPAPFSFHNALHDALYTAMLAERIGSLCTARPLTPRLRMSEDSTFTPVQFATCAFEPPPRRRIGPFSSLEAGLDARSSRRTACPVCGRRQSVLEWHHSNERQYYAVFECPEHGCFLCRLTMTPLKNGTWRGRLSVPELTDPLKEAFELAVRSGLHDCRSSRARRRQAARRKE